MQQRQIVLVLLPTLDSGLLAKWKGPYEVTKKVGLVTCELYLPERWKKHEVFHVNLLRELVEQPKVSTQL